MTHPRSGIRPHARGAIGLAIGLFAAAGLTLAAGPLVGPGRATTARPLALDRSAPGCDTSDAVGARWWRIEPSVGPAGSLAGWTVRIGSRAGGVTTIGLPPESIVQGPVEGMVAVASDDGHGSTVELLRDAACRVVVSRPTDVVRALALGPGGRRLALHVVDRTTRDDLGVRILDVATGRLLTTVQPPTSDRLGRAGLERPWRTVLLWDRAGERLAVASCEPRGCLTRVAAVASGRVVAEAADAADPVMLERDHLVAWDRCSAVPCSVLAVDLAAGRRSVVASGIVAARPVGPGVLAMTTARRGGTVTIADLRRETATGVTLHGPGGRTLMAGGIRGSGDVEVPDGWIPLAAEDLDPTGAGRVDDGSVVRLDEVP
jgi:hypothetical protein